MLLNDNTKREIIKSYDEVLGLDLLEKDEKESVLSEKYILDKIKQRSEAKQNKNYDEADSIRDELLSKGIVLIDTREGTIYKEV